MRNISFHAEAFEEYNYWAISDAKIFERVRRLITDISRNPFVGIGKPELLKGERTGYWSRRITEEQRIVYKVTDKSIIIAQCKNHY